MMATQQASGMKPIVRPIRWLIVLAGMAVLSWPAQTPAAEVINPIRLNTVGFLPELPKQATIAMACTNFQLVRSRNGTVLFSGTVSGPNWNSDTAENLFTADFSSVRESGEFTLRVPGVGESAPFTIHPGAFTSTYRTAMLGMYLWRCGTAVSATCEGRTFAHDACHTNDAGLDLTGGKGFHDATGGWHDAGDFNKYVVNAGVSVGVMLRAWEDFSGALKSLKLQLPPETNAVPDYLREVKWELDWLLKMQAADGSVYHMVSARKFDRFEMPEDEVGPRYFSSWSSAATALTAAMLAQAARDYRPFDAAFADHCLQAAQLSYAFLAQHPGRQLTDRQPFSTGIYQIRSESGRLWAAAELWESTGHTNYLHDFETVAQNLDQPVAPEFDYGDVRDLAMFTYLSSHHPGRDPGLVRSVSQALQDAADEVVANATAEGYARPLGTKYFWGCNGTVARQTALLHAAEKISANPKYRTTALGALNYLLGRNYFGRSFVTGVGFEPPLHPHDRLSASLDLGVPCPGRLVGGPQPGARDWADSQADFTRNEIAINWNTALIYALAEFLPE